MPLDLLIARWLACFWIIIGLSHALHPRLWVALLLPLRDRDTGGFILGGLGLPIGLVFVLGHNIWVRDIPVIVTIAGWMTLVKSAVYLLVPSAHRRVMHVVFPPQTGLRVVGIVAVVLGALVGYDAFVRR